MNIDDFRKFSMKISKLTNGNKILDTYRIYKDSISFLFGLPNVKKENYLLKDENLEHIKLTKNIFDYMLKNIENNEKNEIYKYDFKLKLNESNFCNENDFLFTKPINFVMNFLQKVFNARIILYYYEKLGKAKDLKNLFDDGESSKKKIEDAIFNYLNGLVGLNECKFLSVIFKNFALYLNDCHKMEIYSTNEVKQYIKKFKNSLRDLSNEETANFFLIFNYILGLIEVDD